MAKGETHKGTDIVTCFMCNNKVYKEYCELIPESGKWLCTCMSEAPGNWKENSQ